jgi:hypothetical protein
MVDDPSVWCETLEERRPRQERVSLGVRGDGPTGSGCGWVLDRGRPLVTTVDGSAVSDDAQALIAADNRAADLQDRWPPARASSSKLRDDRRRHPTPRYHRNLGLLARLRDPSDLWSPAIFGRSQRRIGSAHSPECPILCSPILETSDCFMWLTCRVGAQAGGAEARSGVGPGTRPVSGPRVERPRCNLDEN